jgi:hypothetical protein
MGGEKKNILFLNISESERELKKMENIYLFTILSSLLRFVKKYHHAFEKKVNS